MVQPAGVVVNRVCVFQAEWEPVGVCGRLRPLQKDLQRRLLLPGIRFQASCQMDRSGEFGWQRLHHSERCGTHTHTRMLGKLWIKEISFQKAKLWILCWSVGIRCNDVGDCDSWSDSVSRSGKLWDLRVSDQRRAAEETRGLQRWHVSPFHSNRPLKLGVKNWIHRISEVQDQLMNWSTSEPSLIWIIQVC